MVKSTNCATGNLPSSLQAQSLCCDPALSQPEPVEKFKRKAYSKCKLCQRFFYSLWLACNFRQRCLSLNSDMNILPAEGCRTVNTFHWLAVYTVLCARWLISSNLLLCGGHGMLCYAMHSAYMGIRVCKWVCNPSDESYLDYWAVVSCDIIYFAVYLFLTFETVNDMLNSVTIQMKQCTEIKSAVLSRPEYAIIPILTNMHIIYAA